VRTVPVCDLPFEFTLNALRLVEGFTERLFEERTGLSRTVLQAPIERAQTRGLLEREADRWRPTARGRQFLNDLQELFLPV
jgi:oxygen-independent coproporphyrinogen-3 oxidase